MFRTDICIAGAGIIGLSLALELQSHGLRVIVLEAGGPMQQASAAAAGMLAANDPHNPPALSALAHLSASLYPAFLERIAQLSGTTVPFQTSMTLQSLNRATEFDGPLLKKIAEVCGFNDDFDDGLALPSSCSILRERSIDPRQLAPSLLAAVHATSVQILGHGLVMTTHISTNSVQITTPTNTIEAAHFIDCTGAWANDPTYKVVPIKGQMLAVALPKGFLLKLTVRTPDIYVVPRTTGPSAGRAIIGATVEDSGFDTTVNAAQIDELLRHATALLPALTHAAILESWAGLRPATPDRLPVLGPHPTKPQHWAATGHYRNGILLAPATAQVMSQLILGEVPTVPLEAFSPNRAALRKVP